MRFLFVARFAALPQAADANRLIERRDDAMNLILAVDERFAEAAQPRRLHVVLNVLLDCVRFAPILLVNAVRIYERNRKREAAACFQLTGQIE